jgi:sugar/nucleoside kinase (ribokinase family)
LVNGTFLCAALGENAIVIVAGANSLLTEQDVVDAESLISSSTVVICQLETKPSVSLAALKLARKHGGKVLLVLQYWQLLVSLWLRAYHSLSVQL